MTSTLDKAFELCANLDDGSENLDKFDSIVVVASDLDNISVPTTHFFSEHMKILKSYKKIDKEFENTETFIALSRYESHMECHVFEKLVFSPTGPLNRDYDDVRRFADAANKGVKRILKSGARKPLLLVLDPIHKFIYQEMVAILGALEAIYVPIEIREDVPARATKVDIFGAIALEKHPAVLKLAGAIEMGRIVCRDIGGSDPERMAAPFVADYVRELFAKSSIHVQVIENELMEEEYPLLSAVNRAAKGISRHHARVIHLTYTPDGPYDTTLALVGKGITYDTGGTDIKAGGVMAGMHRDKCGAAAVAGFFQTLSILKPKNIKVIGAMAMVRNSVGPNGYVADELVTSRAGVRVRVGNTDAEGRMVMADLLCHLKEKVIEEKNPILMTIATLTGHAALTVGQGYSIIMENGPAKAEKIGPSLVEAGDDFGDMFELSTIRREDYEFVKGKSEYEDILQSNNLPSSKTPRGHQSPAAFLIRASGLDKHGIDSNKPLKYCHIDIAGSEGPFPGIPSGAPIPALTKHFILPQIGNLRE